MSKSTNQSVQRDLLLRMVDEAYDKTGWIEVSLRGALRRVTAKEAAWPPGPGRRTIAEIVLHSAYWKYAITRRITGGKRGSFALKGSNWFAVPKKLSDSQWKQYVKLLDDTHEAFHNAVARAAWSRLNATSKDAGAPISHIYAIALHDAYHMGQIRTIRALYKQATSGRKKRKAAR